MCEREISQGRVSSWLPACSTVLVYLHLHVEDSCYLSLQCQLRFYCVKTCFHTGQPHVLMIATVWVTIHQQKLGEMTLIFLFTFHIELDRSRWAWGGMGPFPSFQGQSLPHPRTSAPPSGTLCSPGPSSSSGVKELGPASLMSS